jgi:hypothetical protein
LQKKARIFHLLSERVILLVGIRILEKINNISFIEKEWIKGNLPENSYLLSDDKLAVLHIIKDSNIKTYELILEKDILLSMLTPGLGQSYFDNLMLEIKAAIQNEDYQISTV